MAKMRVHELAKELDKQSKDIIAFLQDKGYEIKAAQSSIEEDAIDLVRQKFGKDKAENAPKKEKAEGSSQGVSDAKADKTVQVKSAPENGQGAAKKQAAPENRNAASEEPKKKKKIIFVSNSQNSSMSGGRQGQGNGNGNRRPNDNNNRQASQQQAPHKIIRPTQKPIPVSAEPYDVRQKQQQERRLEQKRQENREKASANANVQNKPSTQEKPYNSNVSSNTNNNADSDNRRPKGQNRQGFNNNQGNNRGASFASGGNRNFNGGERPQKGNGGQDNRFKKGGNNKDFMPESPIKDTEKHRDEEKRRIGQEKDKRSKKDLIYEEDEIGSKNFNRPGRFIKPEKKEETPAEEKIKVITLPETLTIKELADKMKIQPSAIIKKLFMQGQIVTVNSEISFEDAENIAIEYEIICEKEVKINVIEELLKEEEEDASTMVPRPPVICVMGHVDHGKTSLLDAIRKTNVTDKEAGGITQAIGAYTVNVNNQKITFLDTPGHEAFTAMRMRGANSTDIAVLVVAADDGVMPQTIEAINHAKAAGIEIIVAVNKIDKPSANIDRVKQELTEHELIPVDWGGSTEFVPVSAKSGEGIGTLLETILLTAEILELKANPNRRARGLVIEAELDKGRGPVATVLVQKGTLHVGDFISAGASHGKVRAMIDDKGRRVKEALPSMPVEILGLSDVPSAGEVFVVHENDKSAKSYADTYMSQYKEEMLADTKLRMSLDDLFNQIQEGNLKELNLIVKADVQGSVEALKQSLVKLSNDEIVVKCIHGGVGAINESDVTLASASSAIIIGFNVRPDATAKAIAEREGVDVRLYKVIYQAIDDIESAMKGMLDPIFEEKVIGHAEVRQIFKASAIGNIAGSYILDGEFQRGCKIRITREGEQIYEGSLASLKRFKDDVKEVKAGFECGLVFEGFDKMQELDIVEAYIMVEVPRT
ncbi:MAG: translation initiation factor IF-2 [Lachnospiraceae bacterium]|nr:translation initiation factor IF-2 [Lachnospiraceae bacterium]